MTKKAFAWLFLLILAVASLFRIPGLDLRPMHHDEANQAVKLGLLLEEGQYRYDKTDHHGPSLYYLSWPLARLLGGRTLASQNEWTIRTVPVFFGLGTLALFILFLPAFGRAALLWSSLGLALSPAMVYFSRFYIQEPLLVFFLTGFLASLWRYWRRPSIAWAMSVGFFAGMMYATKETSVILFAAAAVSGLSLLTTKGKRTNLATERKEGREDSSLGDAGSPRRLRPTHVFLAVGIALLITTLLFSSFFTNPRGLIDSVLSFQVYFVRAGETTFHAHPWTYYLKLLTLSKTKGGPIWSEAFLLLLALIGASLCFSTKEPSSLNRSWLKFLLFYTVLTAAVFSFIPYKTPWNLLPFHLGIILLAGAGAEKILKMNRKLPFRALLVFFLGTGFSHLAWQSYRTNFVFPADPRNPYAYAQTSPGYSRLVDRVEEIASIHPDGLRVLIKVVAGPYETWPLPWSLRKFERVGYWLAAAEVDLSDYPPLVIASAEEAIDLEPALGNVYESEYFELRPNVLLVLFVRTDIWENYLRNRWSA